MQTQVIDHRAAGTAYLERYPAAGGAPQKTRLESFPFMVGRNDTADLHIPSSRVSREHAILLKHGSVYRVQDLGSTNGTFLNGRQVEAAALHDGDLLAFADVEFCFFSGSAASRQTATQVIDFAPAGGLGRDASRDRIREARRLHEVLVRRGIVPAYRPVVDLAARRVAGYEAVESRPVEPSAAELRGVGHRVLLDVSPAVAQPDDGG